MAFFFAKVSKLSKNARMMLNLILQSNIKQRSNKGIVRVTKIEDGLCVIHEPFFFMLIEKGFE